MPIITRYDQFWQLKVNYNMITSEMKDNGQLQHVTISSYNWRSITTRYDQFLQFKVNYKKLRSVLIIKDNYNTLQLVLIIKGQLQHIPISSEN
jgi:hypothetical protein